MLSKKTLGVAGAAILGSMALLVTNSAHAIKILDTAPTDRAGVTAAVTSFTYAAETLLSTETTEAKGGDKTKYYDVGGDANLILSVPADIGANTSDTYVVTVALDGMVFREGATPALASAGANTNAAFNTATGGRPERNWSRSG